MKNERSLNLLPCKTTSAKIAARRRLERWLLRQAGCSNPVSIFEDDAAAVGVYLIECFATAYKLLTGRTIDSDLTILFTTKYVSDWEELDFCMLKSDSVTMVLCFQLFRNLGNYSSA